MLCVACARGDQRPIGRDPALADTLRQQIEDAYDFSRPDIVKRMAELYPDSGQIVSASGGELITNVDSLRKGIASFWSNVGHNMRQPKWEWDSVYVDRLGPDAAVLTGKWRVPHIAPDGRPHVIGGAWTAVFRRIDGKWKIVQEHLSAGA